MNWLDFVLAGASTACAVATTATTLVTLATLGKVQALLKRQQGLTEMKWEVEEYQLAPAPNSVEPAPQSAEPEAQALPAWLNDVPEALSELDERLKKVETLTEHLLDTLPKVTEASAPSAKSQNVETPHPVVETQEKVEKYPHAKTKGTFSQLSAGDADDFGSIKLQE